MNLAPLLLEIAIISLLAGSVGVARIRDSHRGRRWSVAITAIALGLILAAWLDFAVVLAPGIDPVPAAGGFLPRLFILDELNAPLLALVAFVFLIIVTTTVTAKLSHFSFSRSLALEALTLATLASHEPWLVIAWLTATAILPYREMKTKRESTRAFVVHMGVATACLVAGQALLGSEVSSGELGEVAAPCLLAIGVLIRAGIVPAHCWVTDLFARTAFGSAMLFTLPMLGLHGALILLRPIAPGWVLATTAAVALVSSIYASGMALVQREARRFFCFLMISQSGLVLAGLTLGTRTGLVGGLCLWISSGLALAGVGLVLRAMEVRVGTLSLTQFHGLYDRVPLFGAFFLVAGLTIAGFPGTCGFLGSEMLFDGALTSGIFAGVAVILTSALVGIAILQIYFRVFGGAQSRGTIAIHRRPRERFAMIALATLIIVLGIYPTPLVTSRHRSADRLISQREKLPPRLPGEGERLDVRHELHGVDHSLLDAETAVLHSAKRR